MTMTDPADLVWDKNDLQSEAREHRRNKQNYISLITNKRAYTLHESSDENGLKAWQKLAQERKNG